MGGRESTGFRASVKIYLSKNGSCFAAYNDFAGLIAAEVGSPEHMPVVLLEPARASLDVSVLDVRIGNAIIPHEEAVTELGQSRPIYPDGRTVGRQYKFS